MTMTLSAENSMMGEQPLLSVKAHVYHIDPKSKKSWIPATSQAVPVSFFYDSTRTLYRIISVEGTKAVINSIVTPSTVVSKTSQKFLQWSDSRANMVYGLGFSREEDLASFLDKFKEVKDLSQRHQHDDEEQQQSLGSQSSSSTIATATGLASTPQANGSVIQQTTGQIRSISPASSASSSSSPRPPPLTPAAGGGAAATTGGSPSNAGLNEAQLRVENERLRDAFAKSSANAEKWRIQLRSLEEEKCKLLKALEESHTNLSRWESEVSMYRNRVSELESRKQQPPSGDNGDEGAASSSAPRGEIERLKNLIHNLEKRNQSKDVDINSLTGRLDELRLKESNMGQNNLEKLQTMESDNRALKLCINDMQEKLSRQVALNESFRCELRQLKAHMSKQVMDCKRMEEKLVELIGINPS